MIHEVLGTAVPLSTVGPLTLHYTSHLHWCSDTGAALNPKYTILLRCRQPEKVEEVHETMCE